MTVLWNLVLGISLKVWGYVAAAGMVLAMFWAVWSKGRKSMREDVNRSSAETSKRMLEAAVNAPAEKSDVVKDLRSGRF
jgi:hypothetical protein